MVSIWPCRDANCTAYPLLCPNPATTQYKLDVPGHAWCTHLSVQSIKKIIKKEKKEEEEEKVDHFYHTHPRTRDLSHLPLSEVLIFYVCVIMT